jgi:hypothetical protein
MPTPQSNEPLPPYSYVPGGTWPHPISSPHGHSFGRPATKLMTVSRADGSIPSQFVRGAELFNAGYYWEAHDVWEGLWHAYGRHGAIADVIKAMIKLAAAGVKVREGQEHGVRIHSRRAADLFALVGNQAGRHQLGLDLEQWAQRAREISENPPRDPGPPGAPVLCVFPFDIEINASD